MKKRIISLVLVVAMLLCVLPAASAAETPDITTYYLSLNDSISISFKVAGLNAQNFGEDGYYVTFKKGNEAESAPIYKATKIDGDKYVFTFDDLTPRQLGTDVVFTVYDADGEKVESTTKSVLSYCNQVLTTPGTSGNLKTLVVDLLNYGAAAQTWFKDTTPLVNAGLTAEQKLLASQSTPKLTKDTVDNTDGAIVEAGLALENAVQVYFVAGKDKGVETLDVTVGTKTYEGIKAESNGRFYFDKLNAAQMREKITVQAKDAKGEAVGGTLTYSIVSYAYDSVGDIEALTTAMMKYGDTAAGYVEKPNADTVNALIYDDFSTLDTNLWSFGKGLQPELEDGKMKITFAPGTAQTNYSIKQKIPTDKKISVQFDIMIPGDTTGNMFEVGLIGSGAGGATAINVGVSKTNVSAQYSGTTGKVPNNETHTIRVEINPFTQRINVFLDNVNVAKDKAFTNSQTYCDALYFAIKNNKISDSVPSETTYIAYIDNVIVKEIAEVQSDVLLTDEASKVAGETLNVTKSFNATSGRISFEWDYTLDPHESKATDAKVVLKSGGASILNISAKHNGENYVFWNYDGKEDGSGQQEHETDKVCVAGTKYHVKVVVDTEYDRYDMYVEGEKIIDFWPLRSAVDTLDGIQIQATDSAADVTFANIVVKKTDERIGVLYSNGFSNLTNGVYTHGVDTNVPFSLATPYEGSVVIELRMRPTDANECKILLRKSGTTYINFGLWDGKCHAGSGQISDTESKINEWNDIKIVINYADNNYTAYVNGKAIVTDRAYGNSVTDAPFAGLAFAGSFYLDDVIVCKAG